MTTLCFHPPMTTPCYHTRVTIPGTTHRAQKVWHGMTHHGWHGVPRLAFRRDFIKNSGSRLALPGPGARPPAQYIAEVGISTHLAHLPTHPARVWVGKTQRHRNAGPVSAHYFQTFINARYLGLPRRVAFGRLLNTNCFISEPAGAGELGGGAASACVYNIK